MREKGLGTDAFAEQYLLADKIQRSDIEIQLGQTEKGKQQLEQLKGFDTDAEHFKVMSRSLNKIASTLVDKGEGLSMRTTS